METYTVALFGEAEKGDYQTPYFCRTTGQLLDYLGNPPPDTQGLYYAVQALLFRRSLIFFRVQQEGFSFQDYLLGLNFLNTHSAIPELAAVCLPGMGNAEVLEASESVCAQHHSILITNESDFYDYLTDVGKK
jgi:hypothetical protein